MDYYWPVTVKMNSREYFSPMGPSYYVEGEIKNRQRALGFCTNNFCFGRPRRNSEGRYFVDGIVGMVYMATEDQSADTCPSCTHSLFWSRQHEYLSNKQCKERKIRTLDEIYDRVASKSE